VGADRKREKPGGPAELPGDSRETPPADRRTADREENRPSQLLELALFVAGELGCRGDRELAELAEVSVDTWPTGEPARWS
jgi:hypothetical protein